MFDLAPGAAGEGAYNRMVSMIRDMALNSFLRNNRMVKTKL